MDGFGTLIIANKEKLVGAFKDGKVNGSATYYPHNKPPIIGNW